MPKVLASMITVLVRYGAVPEVARCSHAEGSPLQRGERVVVRTHRGLELGTVLESIRSSSRSDAERPPTFEVIRIATTEDIAKFDEIRLECFQQFGVWEQRIAEWNLDLQLVDLEQTLDQSKWILYVLNERGPECTKLALQAAAAGLGIVEVQPVSSDGPVHMNAGGGCGSCGCS